MSNKEPLNMSVSQGPIGIGNSKLGGECTCVARRPKNVGATSGLNELLTTTCDVHTCFLLILKFQ